MHQFNKIISFWKCISCCSSFKVISKYVIIFVNITWINIFIIARRKKWYKYACFPIWLADDYFQQYKVFHVAFIIYILFPFLICYTRLLMRWNVRPKKTNFPCLQVLNNSTRWTQMQLLKKQSVPVIRHMHPKKPKIFLFNFFGYFANLLQFQIR